MIVRHETSPAFMAALQGRTQAEMAERFADGHRAYVAWCAGKPAAWGWVATRTARIGELDSTVTIPTGERYLWNFVTLKSHRGQGVYPRLLDAIVKSEDADRFWIAYAPENHASGAGIAKAGFAVAAELSFDEAGHPAVRGEADGGGALASGVLGLPEAEALAPCWRCARSRDVMAGKGPSHTCAPGRCTCDYQRPDITCAGLPAAGPPSRPVPLGRTAA
jgi:GNAT superfamily N-acetyltransferase